MTEIIFNEDTKRFRDSILKIGGAERLMLCYQCGTCTNDCPVAKRIEEFRPRNIARLAMFGQKQQLFSSDLLWLCAGCYTCYEHCPQKVHVSEIISALRRLAFIEGKIHPTIKSLLTALSRYGYIMEIGEFENELREEENLPPAPEPAINEISTIMEKTGTLKKVGGN
ncbi:4Fe-4S dicluster domain-containing protein [Candidatus Bathyarchaeota archaeon]|nr:4Fe-4S dicluster domain-containing protein [Candidatus Bathyarchaeota archaeon]